MGEGEMGFKLFLIVTFRANLKFKTEFVQKIGMALTPNGPS